MNAQARKRPTIGLLAEVGRSPYHRAIWEGLIDAALELDVNLIWYLSRPLNAPGYSAQHGVFHDVGTSERVDGLLISGTMGNYVATAEFASFVNRYRPLPMVGITQTPGLPCVVVDNGKGMRDLVTHLVEVHRYRRIAFICGPESSEEAALRYQAYVDALTAHDLPLDPDLVTQGSFVFETGMAAVRLLLDERKAEFDAIVAANDWMALGALRELKDRGVRIPNDVAVGGFDDTKEAFVSSPPLATVQQPIRRLGYAAIEVMLKLLAGEQVPEQTVLPTELVVRQSCGCSEPVAARAAEGAAAREAKSLRGSIAAQREEIVSEMAQAMGGEEPSSSRWADQLLDAFLEEMTSDSTTNSTDAGLVSSDHFRASLDDVLQQADAASSQLNDWQEVISVMRRHVSPYMTDITTLSRAEELFGHGRAAISRTVQRNWVLQEVAETQQGDTIANLRDSLTTTTTTQHLVGVLNHRLPQLGFSTFYLSLYDGQERPAEWSRLILACDRGEQIEADGAGRRFLTHRLLPDELMPQERRYTWVVGPLGFEENLFGCLTLEVGSPDVEVYSSLVRLLSSAMQDMQLLRQLETRSVQLLTAAQVARAASSTLDPDELIQQVVELVQERFGLYYVGLFLLDGKRAVLRAGTGEAGKKMLEQRHKLPIGAGSMIGQCIADHQACISQDVGKEAARFINPLLPETHSEMAIPLITREGAIGALSIQSQEREAFSEEDIIVLQTMADQLSNAIANARLYAMLQRENLRMEAELRVTQRLQQMLLPTEEELQAIEELDIAGFMEPAEEVGGDYYDVLNHDGQIKIGIGDVTGHGLESGVVMLMLQTAVRTLLTSEERDPVRFLSILNQLLRANTQRMQVKKSMTLALLDYHMGQLRVSGQHEYVIVVRKDGQVELNDTLDLGLPLGLMSGVAEFVQEKSIDLQPGDGIVLYSDGITEAENESGEFYGLERLCNVVGEHWNGTAEDVKDEVVADVKGFIRDQKVYDDITLVVVKQE
jgi:serine phosphatase RsbU (regulator of sigma subunit)/DNA-binding LacI/PurR family transcriptional regulator